MDSLLTQSLRFTPFTGTFSVCTPYSDVEGEGSWVHYPVVLIMSRLVQHRSWISDRK